MSGLPTDNLYKFIAFSGLLVALYSATFPIIVAEKDLQRWEQLQVEMAELASEIEFLREDAAIDEAMGLESPERGADHLRESRFVRKANAVMGAKLKAAGRLNARGKWLLRLFIVGSSVGIALSAVGFILWYTRLQRPQDLLLAREAQLSKRIEKPQRGKA
jgi:hypothetical protein